MPGKLFAKLCDSSLLYHSWLEVKRKGSSGGIDGRSIEEFESNLSENLKGIKSELQQKNWSPEPYLRIHIPKKDGELRKLGMLTIRDKIVQCAIRTLVEPRFEKMFVANSYGYRPNKGHNKAIKFARHCCSQKGSKGLYISIRNNLSANGVFLTSRNRACLSIHVAGVVFMSFL